MAAPDVCARALWQLGTHLKAWKRIINAERGWVGRVSRSLDPGSHLAAMTIFDGKRADKNHEINDLYRIITLSGLATLALYLLTR